VSGGIGHWLKNSAEVAKAWIFRALLTVQAVGLRRVRRRRRVVLLSRQSEQVPPDFQLLAEAIGRADPSVEIDIDARCQGRGLLGQARFLGATLTQQRKAAAAQVVVLDSYSPVISAVPHDRPVRVVQMWHALGAFKRFGLSILDRPAGRDSRVARAMRMHAGYDVVLASAAGCRQPFAEAFGVDPTAVQVAPLPRVDALLDPARQAARRARILAAYPVLAAGPVVVYAPTLHRHHGLQVDVADLAERAAGRGLTLVQAPHPLAPAVEGALLATPFTTEELLSVATALVTD